MTLACVGACVWACAAALSGCGQLSPDLFALTRSGSIPGARLMLLVGDGGTVHCNGGRKRRLPDRELLQARTIVRELEPDARRRVSLPPGPGSILRYALRMEAGTVAFSDTSARSKPAFAQVALFARRVAQEVCRLPR